MLNTKTTVKVLSLAAALICMPLTVRATTDQVLATVGQEDIHSHELEQAIASSPFSTQFNTMGEDEQASLRGDMLRRIVSARLLGMEAKRIGLDKTANFKRGTADIRLGLLYREYMDKLRARITIPEATQADMKEQFKGDADALEAAKSSYIAKQFREAKAAALQQLQTDSNIRFYESRIRSGIKPETVLMEANGLRIVYGDIVEAGAWKKMPNPDWIKEQLHKRSELLLVAAAAERGGANVEAQLSRFNEERLPALALEQKMREWIPNEKTMRDWYKKHPEIGHIPASYHIGQIVVASKEEAEALRARILKGESLFNLAASNSIDPVGRKQNGDMGWIIEGRGMPELIKVLPTLKDEEVSPVIATPSGYHLVVVLERRIGRDKPFADVRDRVRQMIVNQNLPGYLGELEKRYTVTWKLMAPQAASQAEAKQ